MSTSNGDGLFYESDGLYADYTYDGNDNRVAIVRADALDALVSGRDRYATALRRLAWPHKTRKDTVDFVAIARDALKPQKDHDAR